jgi:hypothetical protein
MIPVPSGVRVWLAVGRTDMRRGMNGLRPYCKPNDQGYLHPARRKHSLKGRYIETETYPERV